MRHYASLKRVMHFSPALLKRRRRRCRLERESLCVLHVDADKGAWIRRARDEIAGEAERGAQLDVARIPSAIDDNGAHGSLHRIADGELPEAEFAAKLFAGLLCPGGAGPFRDQPGRHERVLYVMPAAHGRLRKGAGRGDLGGADHPGIIFKLVGMRAEIGLLGLRKGLRARGIVNILGGVNRGGCDQEGEDQSFHFFMKWLKVGGYIYQSTTNRAIR